MNKGIDTTIEDSFAEVVIRKKGLTPLEYYELGYKAALAVCSKKELTEKTWLDVVNNKKG